MRTLTEIEHLIDRDSSPDCWLWKGAKTPFGYGLAWDGKRMGSAHRVVYRMVLGEFEEPELDHLCRVRSCVNPAHLEPVSKSENFLRGMHPNAVAHRLGKCKRGHQFSEKNSYIRPNGLRNCRICERDRKRAERARGKAA